jgi:hypothetical protein
MTLECNFLCRSATALFIFLILFLTPFLLLYYVGYERNKTWNVNSNLTTCTVINRDEIKVDCPDAGGGGGEHDKKHSENLGGCYNGEITVMHSIYPWSGSQGSGKAEPPTRVESARQEYKKNFTVIFENYDNVKAYLDEHFRIGTNISCYYQIGDPGDIELSLKGTLGVLIGAIVFLILGITGIAIWIAIELREKCKNGYETIIEREKEVSTTPGWGPVGPQMESNDDMHPL